MIVSDLIGKATKRLGAGASPHLFRLSQRWFDIVGDHIGSHTEPIKLYKKQLVIRVDHPAWMHEIRYLTNELLTRIKEELSLPELEEIKFELGKISKNTKRKIENNAHQALPPLTGDEEDFIETASNEICDDEIRQAAVRAMKLGFRTKKKA